MDTQFFLFFLLVWNKSEGLQTCELATYNCPCEKHRFSKSSTHNCSDYPCALLILIAKASHNGNCIRLNSNDISVGSIGIRGNSISYLLNFRFNIVASMTLFIIFITENVTSLQSRGGLMFRRRVVGTPIFNVQICDGIPDKSSEIKNSVG